jgi:hypothetical protein
MRTGSVWDELDFSFTPGLSPVIKPQVKIENRFNGFPFQTSLGNR